jgi:hypothetical protein
MDATQMIVATDTRLEGFGSSGLTSTAGHTPATATGMGSSR